MREESAVSVATDALTEIDQLEAQLTVFRESSEVSQVNQLASSSPVHVEKSLFDLLILCKELHRETEGAFDITSGPLTRCWGFLRREGRFPSLDEVKSAKDSVGSDKLLLDDKAQTVRFAKSGVEINLGSIGKGYALDRVSKTLERQVRTALINAGASSIRAIGDGGGREPGWLVGLRDPRSKTRRIGSLRISDCAMSTSGSEEQFFEHEGRRFGHIIDPRTGWPAKGVSSVTVVSASGAISDALATAFFVGGRELAERYCVAHSEVLVILLASDSQTPIVIGSNSGCRNLEIKI